MHDVLILYCEIINDENLKEIAQHCWQIIKKNRTDFQNIRNKNTFYAINCMLFLKEAFINRKKCLYGFINEFETLISEALNTKMDVICLAKIAESICLFETKHLDLFLLKIFIKKISWVNEIALKSCVSFCRLNREVEYCCYTYLNSLKNKKFLQKYWNLNFIFSIYKSYKIINVYMLLRMLNIVFNVLMYVGLFILIHNGKILELLTLFIQNKMLLLYYFCFFIASILMGEMKYVLPRSIVITYLVYVVLKGNYFSFLLLGLCAYPLYMIFEFFRIGLVSDENLNKLKSQLKKKKHYISFFNCVAFIAYYIAMAIIGFFYAEILQKFCEILFYILVGIVLLIEIHKIVINIICKFKYKKYTRQKINLRMERITLEKNLQSIYLKREKALYLEYLNEKQVFLYGNWTKNKRPDLEDEKANRLLSVLDIKDLNIKL